MTAKIEVRTIHSMHYFFIFMEIFNVCFCNKYVDGGGRFKRAKIVLPVTLVEFNFSNAGKEPLDPMDPASYSDIPR